MVTVIREDQFQQCFELVISLWPADMKIKSSAEEDLYDPDSFGLSALYCDIYKRTLDFLEDMDCRMVHIVNYAVFQVGRAKSRSMEAEFITRDSIDIQQVKAVLNNSLAWEVA
jgi:hypothetical protein